MELPFDTPTERSCSSRWRIGDPSSIRSTISVDVARARAAMLAPRSCAARVGA